MRHESIERRWRDDIGKRRCELLSCQLINDCLRLENVKKAAFQERNGHFWLPLDGAIADMPWVEGGRV